MRIQLKTLLLFLLPLVVAVVAAYAQWLFFGLPAIPPGAQPPPVGTPQGFPAWLRLAHYINFLFLILLIRSGLQILFDHPRLYWNVHWRRPSCSPPSKGRLRLRTRRVEALTMKKLPRPLLIGKGSLSIFAVTQDCFVGWPTSFATTVRAC